MQSHGARKLPSTHTYIYIMHPSNVSRDIIILYKHTLKTHVPIKYMERAHPPPPQVPVDTLVKASGIGTGSTQFSSETKNGFTRQIISKISKKKHFGVDFGGWKIILRVLPNYWMSFLLPKCRDRLITEAEDYPCVKTLLGNLCLRKPLLPIWFTMLPVHLNDQFPDF